MILKGIKIKAFSWVCKRITYLLYLMEKSALLPKEETHHLMRQPIYSISG